ncbi:MAG: hypothetical protein IPG99_20120 [Ignavibacteria bacterium]|nr:hypothetical protein [Ignavibacteria bacterium]
MVSDTATIYLRNTTPPCAIVKFLEGNSKLKRRPVILLHFLRCFRKQVPYYIVLTHRSAIETWSAAGNSFTANSMNYNFTTSSSQAYGSNLRLLGTRWTAFDY